jgi:type VI secretion system protein VasD
MNRNKTSQINPQPTAMPLRTLACLLLLSLIATGCSMFEKDKPATKASKPASAKANQPTLKLQLFAGGNLNENKKGQPLALVIKFYVLRDVNAFEQDDYATFLDKSQTSAQLGPDLVKRWKTLLVPSQHYEIDMPQKPPGKYLGVVALYRQPDPERWRFAFNLSPKKGKPIVIGLHACAMSVTGGSLVNPPPYPANRLTGVHCPADAMPATP